MSDLIAIVYPNLQTAQDARGALSRLQTEHLIEIDDAVVVTKGTDGKVNLDQTIPLTSVGAAGGALHGGLWGGLIGFLFLAPLLGMVVGGLAGAAGGALSGKASDIGVDDNLMKQLGSQFTPGTAALFVLVRKATPDKVVEELSQYGGTVIRSSLTHDQEAALQQALSGR
jgi:uncharacterized membrane protein